MKSKKQVFVENEELIRENNRLKNEVAQLSYNEDMLRLSVRDCHRELLRLHTENERQIAYIRYLEDKIRPY